MKYQDLTPEQKAKRNRQNAASRARYEAAAYHKVYVRIRKDGGDGFTLEQLKAAADRWGLSVNAFVVMCLKAKI